MAEQIYNPNYAYLDQLSTEQLEELLRVDLVSGEDRNEDLIFHVLEVIEKREKGNPTGRLPDVDKAWAEFKEYYNTPEGDGLSLYPNGSKDEHFMFACEAERFKIQRKPRRLIRHLAVIAALICVVVLSAVPAFGYSSIFQMIGQWTAEQFGFVVTHENNSNTDNNHAEGMYSTLQDALTQYGIEDKVVPQHIPEGFQPEEIWIQEYPESGDIEFSAPYAKGDDYIAITIIQHGGQTNNVYEKNGEGVVHYQAGNIEHYIFRNNNNVIAAWSVNSLECSISTTLAVSELEKIIDSIYKE